MSPQIQRNGNGRLVNSLFLWRAMTVTALLLACVALVIAVVFPTRNAIDQDQLRTSLVESCQTASAPQREALIGVLEDQISQSRAGDLEKFFPSIPPAQLHRLIHKANRARQFRIKQLQSVPPCTERFK